MTVSTYNPTIGDCVSYVRLWITTECLFFDTVRDAMNYATQNAALTFEYDVVSVTVGVCANYVRYNHNGEFLTSGEL